jgi:predicted RecA/RadA family phage recombinase
MVERGEYRAQNPSSPTPGFRLSQLISPKKPWGEIAVEFLAAKKSPETLKAFLNTVLAELWEETHETPTDAHALWNRCEPFEAEAPDGVALITAGVEVQADRLELEIVGWGRDEESWSIAYHVNFFGVSVNNQNPGDSSELVVEGVFDLAKDGSAFVSGAKVYWDNTQQLATANTLTAAGAPTKEIGFAVLSQASGVNAPGGLTTDPTVRVRLTPLGITPVGVSDLDPSVLQKAVVTLTAAQIMAMNGAPVSILPAPAAGQVLVIDQIIAQMKPGATQFTGGGAVTFQYHGTAVVPHSGNIPAATITGAAGSENVVPPPTGTIQPPAATGLDITNGTAAFATGNGVLVVTIFYSLVTLS